MSVTGTRPTSFWIDDETFEILKELVEDLGISRSHVVRDAIRRMAGKTGDVDVTEARRLLRQLEKVISGT